MNRGNWEKTGSTIVKLGELQAILLTIHAIGKFDVSSIFETRLCSQRCTNFGRALCFSKSPPPLLFFMIFKIDPRGPDPHSQPVVITNLTRSPLFKISQNNQVKIVISTGVSLWVWAKGSLMTHTCFVITVYENAFILGGGQ